MIKDASLVLAEYLSLFRDLFNAIVIKGTQILLIEVQNDVYLARTRKNFKSPKMNDRIDDLMIILSVLKVLSVRNLDQSCMRNRIIDKGKWNHQLIVKSLLLCPFH